MLPHESRLFTLPLSSSFAGMNLPPLGVGLRLLEVGCSTAGSGSGASASA